MVFRKPYAFFIKYFKIINLLLVILFSFLGYKLNLIRDVFSKIYSGSLTNFIFLNSEYIGFKMYFLIFLILVLLCSILILLNTKKKPLNDYLFSIMYIFIVLIYLIFVSNIFFTLNERIIEQNSLKLYKDLSFLIIIPVIYFIVKYILIVIGFNLKKFNFTQDIIELKQEEKDNEEIELIFNKNTYKYKRFVRKTIREFKYYILENKFILSIITSVIVVVLSVTLFSVNIFKTNKVSVNETFIAGGIKYKVKEVYETKFNMNYKIIKNDSKFVIANVEVENIGESKSVDFKRVRLLFNKDYVYANNYYNNFFKDLGVPYNSEVLKSGKKYNYLFIFKVPQTYKSKKYTLKFYDKISVEDDEIVGSYKEMKVKAKEIDKKVVEKQFNLNENTIFNKNKYGRSNISILKYDIKGNYIYKKDSVNKVVSAKDVNKTLLILDYKLSIDENSNLFNYILNDSYFFDNFISLTYNINGKEKNYSDVKVMDNYNGKIMLSIPYEVKNANSLNLNINFRDAKIVYKLK